MAKANRPGGSKHNAAMGAWLRNNRLDGISTLERYLALLCVENLDAIETWRDDFDEKKGRRLNHPGATWFARRRACKPPAVIVDWTVAAAEVAAIGRAVYLAAGCVAPRAPGHAGQPRGHGSGSWAMQATPSCDIKIGSVGSLVLDRGRKNNWRARRKIACVSNTGQRRKSEPMASRRASAR